MNLSIYIFICFANTVPYTTGGEAATALPITAWLFLDFFRLEHIKILVALFELLNIENDKKSHNSVHLQAIKQLEASMDGYLGEIKVQLPVIHKKAEFTTQDFLAVLSGIAGFGSGVLGKDPFAALDSALGVIGHFTRCSLGSLKQHTDNINKWMTFGTKYKAFKDSSDLDFDKMDVGAVPEIMQVTKYIVNYMTWLSCPFASSQPTKSHYM